MGMRTPTKSIRTQTTTNTIAHSQPIGFLSFMPRILTAAKSTSYRITAIPSSPATAVVAMIAERRVKRRPSLIAATAVRAKMRAGYQRGK